jgi:3-methyladenine DNA glycosylase AlkC
MSGEGGGPMVQHLLGRKGAPRIALIAPEVLEALSEGLVPTVNLNEFLALDLARLTRSVARRIGLEPQAERIADTMAMLDAFPPVKRHAHISRALYDLAEPRADRDAIAHALATHPSDVARCWATQWIMFSSLTLPDKLSSVRRFAADSHFGVREMAWMAVRDEMAGALDEAVGLLEPWVHDRNENIRRFATEGTRPRGVWCAPIEPLKAQPWRALALLEPLKADPSRYVQNSVANWLNDASKTQPEWVHEVCEKWVAQSPSPATAYIVRRARRTLSRR